MKNRTNIWKRVVIGICAMAIALAGTACQQRHKAQEPSMENPSPSAASGLWESEEPSFSMDAVLYCPYGNMPPVVDAAPSHGGTLINDYFAEEAGKEENKGRYFSVTIDIIYFDFIEEYLESVHEEYMALCSDPAILNYENEYKLWYDTIFQPTPEDLFMIEEKGDADFPRAQFHEYWIETQPEDVQQAYLMAEERRIEGWNKYLDTATNPDILETMFAEDIEAEVGKELDRLKSMGYCLELQKEGTSAYWNEMPHGTLVGYLTGEQLSGFPCSSAHGYCITWNGQEE